ncbi:hypothetical protein BOX15_Mlig004764g1 [Macrostomum lignano]|uniref:UspA domain-containing protein n=1 Tax=Macrostomum lignano TaxID=282301 RepID=A0A267GK57_9PLAT|nr:hypothetical protein BOX15_Mlig004764g1 [Macrostomum lignano]
MASRKVLLPVDGSQHSDRALDWYNQHLRRPDDHVIFLMVAEPPPMLRSAGVPMEEATRAYGDSMSQAVKAGRELADRMQRRCTAIKLEVAGVRFLERLATNAGEAIVQVADEESIDLIIVGNRGLGTVRRTFLGSVSDFVLHHANRPVAVVPPAK